MRRARQVAVMLGLLGASLLAANVAHACEPCAEIWDLEQTAEGAELIIVGRNVGEGPLTGDFPTGGPDWIRVRVDEVLKGEVDGNRIQVNSWDGMCPYGVMADDQSHVMFLVWNGEMYDAVNIGCAVTHYPVQGDEVDVDGQSMALGEFAASLGLEWSGGEAGVEEEMDERAGATIEPESVTEEPPARGGIACLGVPGTLGLASLLLVVVRKNGEGKL